MSDIIDINVQTAIDEVNIIANPNNYVVNINRIIGEQVQSDWTQNDNQAPDYIKNKPSIPTQTNELTNNGSNGIDPFITIQDVPSQVNSDWNATSGVEEILNKPIIPSIDGLASITYVDTQDALKVDKVAGSRLITSAEATILSNTSGVNTGDQDLSGLALKTTSISTTTPLQGGGDLSGNRTLSILQSNTSQNGYLSSTDWNNFNGKFNLPSLTSGSVLFSNGTTIAQNNNNFFWDNTNNRLGIGTTTPYSRLTAYGTLSATTSQMSIVNSEGGHNILRTGISGISNSGFSLISADADGTNQNTRLVISSAGNVGIGTSNPTGRLTIKAPGALSTDVAFRIRNSADTLDLLTVNGTQILIKTNFVSGGALTPISMLFSDNLNAFQVIEGGGGKFVDLGGTSSNIRTYGLLQSQISGVTAAIGLSSFCFRVQGNGQTLIDEAGVNAFVNTAAIMELKATTKGFLPPKMTTTQKNAISSPPTGLIVFDTTLNKLCVRGASAWETITSI